MTKRTIIFCFAAWQCMVAMAQLGDPRDKFSVTATVDGATNTDYRWETEVGQLLENGRLRQGINARLRESGYNKTYMRMYDHVKPFVKLQLKYTIR